MVLMGLFIAFGFAPARRANVDRLAAVPFSGWLQRLVVVAVTWAVVEVVQSRVDVLFLKPSPFRGGAWSFLRAIILFAASKPLIFLVAHLAWFGPVVALGLFHWPAVCREARRLGPGMVLLLGGGLVVALSAESRQYLTFFPAFVLLTACVVERHGFGIGRVLLSRAALSRRGPGPLNVAPG